MTGAYYAIIKGIVTKKKKETDFKTFFKYKVNKIYKGYFNEYKY